MIGVAPLADSRSAFSGSRTSAVTRWPPLIIASSTADPMYPVAPVRKTCIRTNPYCNHKTQTKILGVTTLIDVFRSLEKRRGEFLVYDDGYRVRRHSYADVTRAARGFAARLIAHGVAKGDKVLLWGENRPEWVACYWGIQLTGAIAVPIDYRSSQVFAQRIRDIVDARVILAGDDVDPAGMEVWRLADLDWSVDAAIPSI